MSLLFSTPALIGQSNLECTSLSFNNCIPLLTTRLNILTETISTCFSRADSTMAVTKDFVYARNGNMGNLDNISDGPTLEREPKTTQQKVLGCLRSNLLIILLILAMVAGIAIGFIIRNEDPEFTKDKRRRMYLKFCGDLLLNMLKMIILPLVFSSLVAGMANLPSQAAGKVGGRAVAYYMLTTFLAVLLGILLVTTIKPGDKGDKDLEKTDRETLLKPVDAILDLVR